MQPRIEVARQRFTETENSNVILLRKPPQSAHAARWKNHTTWAVRR